MRKDNDTKFDPDKMHNELAIDEKREGCCKIEICDVGPDDPPPPAHGSSGACPAHHWGQWGEWTQCDKRSASYPHSSLLAPVSGASLRARGRGSGSVSTPALWRRMMTVTARDSSIQSTTRS